MGLSLKGPQKDGADILDEGVMTREVVARYAEEDGLDGNAEAAKVLPARRALWRLCEVYAPRLLAQALRARLDRNDQTGRGGVRELRRALADWLDPPPACGHCGRLLSPDLVAANPAGIPCPTRLAQDAARPRRTGSPRTKAARLVCAAPRGPRASYGTLARPGPGRASGLARCGTLALFSPLVLDPACSASVKMMKHGGLSAYDLAVDRDARILFAVTGDARDGQRVDGAIHDIQITSTVNDASCAEVKGAQTATPKTVDHSEHYSTLITTAARHFSRTLDRAVRANARLALKTQLKYFSPKGTVKRADLVQAAMMGLRRALLDYDPNYTPAGKKSGVKISSYAINWIHQSMGELFADRDVVQVPQWAVGLRKRVADMGISPGQLLAGVLAVAEARGLPCGLVAAADLEAVLAHHGRDIGDTAQHQVERPARMNRAVQVVADLAVGPHLKHDDAANGGGVFVPDDGGVGVGERADAVLHSGQSSTAQHLAAAANAKPPKAKKPVSDERSREQVAAVVADLLHLECTGGALLTALRYGAPPQFVSVSVGGERDDADGGDGESRGGGASAGLHHLHARPDGEDEEDAAIAEAEDRRHMAALVEALAALRATDPEAAEVVRRRHGLDAAGDEETLEQIGERLHSTGRALCREAVRLAYKRGVKAMQASTGAVLPEAQDEAPTTTTPAIRHSTATAAAAATARPPRPPMRPLRPAVVHAMRSTPLPAPAYDNAPGDPEAWTAAAMVF